MLPKQSCTLQLPKAIETQAAVALACFSFFAVSRINTKKKEKKTEKKELKPKMARKLLRPKS